MFTKKDRATFKYTFAHWCAYNMTALNLCVWKPRYLLHDIEKPFLMLLWKDYSKVQKWHRNHNKHHVEYFLKHGVCDFDGMTIDYECSRLTKLAQQFNAMQEFQRKVMQLLDKKVANEVLVDYYCGMRKALKKTNLWNDLEDPFNAFSDEIKQMLISS